MESIIMNNLCHLASLIGVALLAVLSSLPAADWTRFRGPNGTGISGDATIPVEWNDKNILWKKEIPGLGHSSPIVSGDHIFLESASKDQSQRFLYCVSAKNGAILWSYTAPGSKIKGHPKNSPASSTPTTDGKAVYAIFWDGAELMLVAVDFTGKELWKRPLGPFQARHGAGMSPIVINDKVIIALDQDKKSVLSAFSAKNGDPVWSTPRKGLEDCSYSTPFLLERENADPELIVGGTPGITGYRLKDGKELWNWDWKFAGAALRVVGSPIFANGMIIATSGNGAGSRSGVAVSTSGSNDLVWQKIRNVPYVPTLISKGDHLYGVDDKGFALCLDTKTGEDVFVERLAGSFTASPVMINGNIYAINEDGTVFVFEAKPKFKILAKNSVNELVYASPAVADGKLFIRGGSHLFCIGKAEK